MLVDVKLIETERKMGPHHSPKTLRTLSTTRYHLPDDACREVRPDWGEYLPVVTFPAIERQLQSLGAFPMLPENGRTQAYRFGIVRN